ncbi:hypothetical protein OAN61_00115 [bacterium]|nr:hypothetical protein [bacterium]
MSLTEKTWRHGLSVSGISGAKGVVRGTRRSSWGATLCQVSRLPYCDVTRAGKLDRLAIHHDWKLHLLFGNWRLAIALGRTHAWRMRCCCLKRRYIYAATILHRSNR